MNIMKKVLKFAVMALAAALTLAACEKKGGEEETPKVSVDGKQWCFEWSGMGMPINCVLDLGVNTDKTAYFLMDGTVMGAEGWVPYFGGTYKITETDETSGKITIVDPSDPTASEVVFEYKELTDKTVKISNAAPFALENVAATASEKKLEMAQM